MSRWERPATRMSGRHDPTPERARSFQQRVIAADVAAQRPTDQRATIARVLGLLAAADRTRRCAGGGDDPGQGGAGMTKIQHQKCIGYQRITDARARRANAVEYL